MAGPHDHAGGPHDHANGAHDHAGGAHSRTNGAYDDASGTHDHASGTHSRTNGAHDYANGAHSRTNGAHDHASGAHDHACGAHDHVTPSAPHVAGQVADASFARRPDLGNGRGRVPLRRVLSTPGRTATGPCVVVLQTDLVVQKTETNEPGDVLVVRMGAHSIVQKKAGRGTDAGPVFR